MVYIHNGTHTFQLERVFNICTIKFNFQPQFHDFIKFGRYKNFNQKFLIPGYPCWRPERLAGIAGYKSACSSPFDTSHTICAFRAETQRVEE